MVIPLHPETLMEYVSTHVDVNKTWQHYAVYAAWGAAVGQFSDYIFSKVKAVFGDVRKARESTPPSAPAATPPKA
jgi:hypothetical protein